MNILFVEIFHLKKSVQCSGAAKEQVHQGSSTSKLFFTPKLGADSFWHLLNISKSLIPKSRTLLRYTHLFDIIFIPSLGFFVENGYGMVSIIPTGLCANWDAKMLAMWGRESNIRFLQRNCNQSRNYFGKNPEYLFKYFFLDTIFLRLQ